MANIAYELAVRFGTAAYLLSQTKRHAKKPVERDMAEERRRPLSGLDLPPGRPVYWLHAVSMGEVGVAAVLVRELKRQAPNAVAVVSTATVTGFEAAQKIAEIDAVVAARFDIRDLISTMFDAIRPAAIIFVEGDLWRNMIAIARRRGVLIFVANAKLSEKTLDFYRRFPIYSRSLFSRIAHVYAQTEIYRERFIAARSRAMSNSTRLLHHHRRNSFEKSLTPPDAWTPVPLLPSAAFILARKFSRSRACKKFGKVIRVLTASSRRDISRRRHSLSTAFAVSSGWSAESTATARLLKRAQGRA